MVSAFCALITMVFLTQQKEQKMTGKRSLILIMQDTYSPQKIDAPANLQKLITWEPLFTFQNRQFSYNCIPVNNRAERAVEIPIVLDFLARQYSGGEDLLEVGNVLQQYEEALGNPTYLRPRRIIDKFERGKGIENIDVMDLDPAKKYKTIISISTLEHIGQHATPNGEFGEIHDRIDREAPLKAIAKVYDQLEIGGCALITVPFGKLTAGGWYIQFSQEYQERLVTAYGIPREGLVADYLRLVAREKKLFRPRQCWIEELADHLKEVRYDTFWSGARAIAVLELVKQPQPFTLKLDVAPASLDYEQPSQTYRFLMSLGSLKRKLF